MIKVISGSDTLIEETLNKYEKLGEIKVLGFSTNTVTNYSSVGNSEWDNCRFTVIFSYTRFCGKI